MGIIVRLKDMVDINPAWWNILGIILVFLSAGHFSAIVLYWTIDAENPESWLRAFVIVQSWDGTEVRADELPIGSRYIVCLYYALMQISTVGFGDLVLTPTLHPSRIPVLF